MEIIDESISWIFPMVYLLILDSRLPDNYKLKEFNDLQLELITEFASTSLR